MVVQEALVRLGDPVHFVMYEPEVFIGEERAAWVNSRHPQGGLNLTYLVAKQTINGIPETDNLPGGNTEFKFNVPHDPAGEQPRSWHTREECPKQL